jgi:cell division septal protein FtsQ
MNQELVNAPAARSWRDIPQPVKARAMTPVGRWRLTMSTARTVAVAAIVCVLAYGAWVMSAGLRENSRAMPTAAKSVPVRAVELVTSSGGVLDSVWLARTLALAKNVSLMELDLDQLRTQVLSDGQVLTATMTRQFPDKLVVKVTERTPAARVRVDFGSGERELLVASDGVVFAGAGFERPLLDSLPWLGGIALAREGGAWFRPIAEMQEVSKLLLEVRERAPHLYPTWHIISVQKLASDHELEVITKRGATIIFNTRAGYLMQLARLDAIL